MTMTRKERRGLLKLVLLFSLSCIVILTYAIQPSSEPSTRGGEERFKTSIQPASLSAYHIEHYKVEARIDGADVWFLVNITYHVTSGTKDDGYKRFTTPKNSNAKIETYPIIVGGWGLTGAYHRQFSGDDGRYYTEISFTCNGFSGIRMFSMSFKGTNWLVEDLAETRLELLNFGTFSVGVIESEYSVIFPEGFKPDHIAHGGNSASNLLQQGGRWVYNYTMAGTTPDMVFTYTPKMTNYAPSFLMLMAIPGLIATCFVCIIAVGKIWRRSSLDKLPKVGDLSFVQTVALKALGSRLRPSTDGIICRMARASFIDLFASGLVDIAGFDINRTQKKPSETGTLDPFTMSILRQVEASPGPLNEIITGMGPELHIEAKKLARSLQVKGLVCNLAGVMKLCAWLFVSILILGIATFIKGSTCGVVGDTYLAVAGTLFGSSAAFVFLSNYAITRFKQHHLTRGGKRFLTTGQWSEKSAQDEVERLFANGETDASLSAALLEHLPNLLLDSIVAGSIVTFTMWTERVIASEHAAPPLLAPVAWFVTRIDAMDENKLKPVTNAGGGGGGYDGYSGGGGGGCGGGGGGGGGGGCGG